jgi:hypothetical protein
MWGQYLVKRNFRNLGTKVGSWIILIRQREGESLKCAFMNNLLFRSFLWGLTDGGKLFSQKLERHESNLTLLQPDGYRVVLALVQISLSIWALRLHSLQPTFFYEYLFIFFRHAPRQQYGFTFPATILPVSWKYHFCFQSCCTQTENKLNTNENEIQYYFF